MPHPRRNMSTLRSGGRPSKFWTRWNGGWLARVASVLSLTDLYIAGGDAPGWPGATRKHMGHV